ncbi:YchJ family protein [Azospirillum picis]|uniref:SEC-C motif-containing protein n=1 Tax=Azospirillum picis TaxID=488438 RepID=A0ABU0MLN2_9PROT|nr:YchJ family metal-binding protein [Azospirillum picis]MBP2301007.1 SEC-C motif-containing protein [Azospirillum picis]MDQ0534373.1 SEC-C motif-containing protein [Azospirillum picis]
MTACPCGSGRAYDDCCGPILAGAPAATAEALMRSRYTAFVRGDIDHIERTLAPEKQDGFRRSEAEQVARECEWKGLNVIRAAEDGDSGTVEYLLQFVRDGEELPLHERANFRRENGVWFYVDGVLNPKEAPRRVVKVGRNDPCPCGSGRKHKACCGR